MRQLTSLCSSLLLCAALLGTAASGQNSQSYLNDLGSTAYGVNIPVENGFINISNGNLHLEFPLASHPQRGALALNERITYDSRIWMFSTFGSNYHWWPSNVPGAANDSGGWQFISGLGTGTFSRSVISSSSTDCDNGRQGTDDITTSAVTWSDPNESSHSFSGSVTEEDNPCGPHRFHQSTVSPGSATDGSGYQLIGDADGNPIIVDNNGSEVYPQIIDRYGNYLSTDGGVNLKDSTGRVPVIVTANANGNANVTWYDVLAPNGIPDGNNQKRIRYIVTTASVNVATNFGQSRVYEWTSPGLLKPVQSIMLPDGSQYSFEYDSYGELSKVTLPTGGVIQYGYSNFVDSSNTANRWVTSRTVGSNAAMTFTQSVSTTCANYATGCVEKVNLHKPSGDETVYDLTLINGAWNTGVTVYDGSATSGRKLLQTTSSNTYTNGCTSSFACYGANYLSQTLATTARFANPATSAVYTQTQSFFNLSVGKVSDVKEWDYVSTSPSTTTAPTSTPARETQYTYAGNDPSQVKVLDSNGNPAGVTTYGYTTTATATSGVTQHGTQNAGGPYLQSVSHWLNTNTNNPLTTTYTMDDTGQVLTTVDPVGNTAATLTYQCANSSPLTTKNVLNQTTTYGYDCNSGAATSVKDPNDAAANRDGTTYAYEATAGRLQTITYPDGGQTSYSYPSSTEVDTTVLSTPSPSISSQDIVDSFGRKYRHVQAGVSSETSYDANGRVYCVTNPHTSSTAGTDGSSCITAYDGQDRPLTQQQPDGATLGWSYNGASTTSVDETGKGWLRTSDAFGHLIKVVEPNAWITQYAYDGLGNLQRVSQGDGATRTFIYDSLSRLTNECHPEAIAAGQVCSISGPWSTAYTFDANGNTRTKTDARGVQITYTYDALNRLTDAQSPGVSQSSGNPQVAWFHNSYIYDSFTNEGGVVSANSIGRLTAISNNVDAGQTFSYDVMGRNVLQGNYTPSSRDNTSILVRATYDLAGRLASLTYPDGRTVKQGFLGDGNLHTVTFDNWNGSNVGYSYLSSASYFPDGSPVSMTFGNGVTQSYGRNNRLQTSEIRVAKGSTTLLDKQFCHGPNNDPTAPLCTASLGANNGNIQQILDAMNSNNSQGVSYDSINRLSSFSNASGSMQQNFGFYPYAGMGINGGGSPSLTSNQANGRFDNLPCASSLQAFDNAGNQLCDSDANGASRVYSYNGSGQMASVTMQNGGSPFVNYHYLPNGNRVRKETSDGNWTEYVYFGGQAIAEKTADGAWSDYIYANGQKIARADSYDQRIHISGTQCSNCGWSAVAWDLPFTGYTIKPHDTVSWRQFQAGTARGGFSIQFNDPNGTITNWNTRDTNGEVMNNLTIQGQWVNRTADLNDYVNKTVAVSWVTAEGYTAPGDWDEFYSDIAITSTDGTVTPIFTRQPNIGLSFFGSQNMTNLHAVVERSNSGGDAMLPQLNTTYYHGDQIGSTRLTTSAAGWPTSSSTFYPFGKSPGGTVGPDHFQYAGLERDPETGLDHATFRQYSAATGRWMSPDPYDGSMDLGNPQSLNRYSYVLNNPLAYTDPDGEDYSGGLCYWTASNCGGGNGGNVGAGGFALGQMQMSANSYSLSSHTTKVLVIAEDGSSHWITNKTYTFSGLGDSLFGSGSTQSQGTNNNIASIAPSTETIRQASARCSSVGDRAAAPSFASVPMSKDQVAIAVIGLAVNIFARGQAVKAAATSATISQTIKSGYYIAKGVLQGNMAYNQCMAPGVDPTMAMQ